jgi:hypothetical protein
MGKSIWLGGNKEFLDNVEALADKSIDLLRALNVEGKSILTNFYNEVIEDKKDDYMLLPIYMKIRQIEAILRYHDGKSVSNSKEWKIEDLQSKVKAHSKREILYSNPYTLVERSFSTELTFFYYFNLNTPVFKPSNSYLRETPHGLKEDEIDVDRLLAAYNQVFPGGSPQQRLEKILQNDNDIHDHFLFWLRILMNYQQNTYAMMLRNMEKLNSAWRNKSV